VVRLITQLESGFPPRMEHVRQAAEWLIQTTVGEKITRFFDRHTALATNLTSPLGRVRVEAENPRIISDHIGKVQRIMTSKQIKQRNMYNMDDKGFLLGLSEQSKLICTYKGGTFTMVDDGNRKLLTAIESVSAYG